jgi:hypothetical protein
MTGSRHQIVTEVLTGLFAALTEFDDTINAINDHTLTDPLTRLGLEFEQLLKSLNTDPQRITDDIITMRSLVERAIVPAEDPALGGRSHDRRTARGAIGALLIANMEAGKMLDSVGLWPEDSKVTNLEQELVSAHNFGEKLVAISNRLENVVSGVKSLKHVEATEDATPQQRGLINAFASQVEPRLLLIDNELSQQFIDLAALTRMSDFVATVTRSFAATVAGMEITASAGLKATAPRLRRGVQGFVASLRAGTALARNSIVYPTKLQRPSKSKRLAPNVKYVRSIVVLGAERLEPETVRTYIDLSIGDRYDNESLDQAVQALSASELFADATIRDDNGTLIIEVKENPVINRIIIEGAKRVKQEKIREKMRLAPRQIFTRSKARADVGRILGLYRVSGRPAASIEPKIIQLEQNRVDVVFEINEGPKLNRRKP